MRSTRAARALAVVTALGLVVAASGSPATAAKKKKKKCPAMVPAEAAAEAPITIVTPKATEEAPIEIPVEAPAGIPPAPGNAYQNVQVDNKGGDSGLYLRYEFSPVEDYDIYLLDSAGEELASSAGFNPTPFGPFDGTGSGGHSEQGAEQIDGFATADCVGYTVDLATYMGEGGELVLKAWLGEVAPPEEE